MPRTLSKDEYLATFLEPMRRLEADEVERPVPIGAYVDECLREVRPSVPREQFAISHVYENGDQSFYHVLVSYGVQNRFLVLVVDRVRQEIHGHYLLDLNTEYGLRSPGDGDV